jgi:hypothetical protein
MDKVLWYLSNSQQAGQGRRGSMGEKLAILVAVGITVPLAALLIYFAFRNFFASIRNLKDTVDTEAGRVSNERSPRSVNEAAGSTAADWVKDVTGAANLNTAVFTHFQEQAKKSDDAHKARIRAHVQREVPPITPEGREAIELGKRARLAIKHVFPPRLPQRSMSYFGGLPIVPDDFDWPTLHNRKGLLGTAELPCADRLLRLAAGAGTPSVSQQGLPIFLCADVWRVRHGRNALRSTVRAAPGDAEMGAARHAVQWCDRAR